MDIRKILDSGFFYDLYHDIIGTEKKIFAKDYIGDVKGKKILDIGCGTAQIVRYLGDADEYVGFDMSPRYVEYARKKYRSMPNVSFDVKNINDAQADEYGKYDRVLMMGIMMNLDDDEIHRIMEIIKLLLKPEGEFLSYDSVYLEKNHPIAKFMLDIDRGHHLRTLEEYSNLMNAHWGSVDYDLRFDMLRVPYNELLFRCSK